MFCSPTPLSGRVKFNSKFHVTVVQRRLRNVQKSTECDGRAKQPIVFFAFFVAVAVVVAKAPYRS